MTTIIRSPEVLLESSKTVPVILINAPIALSVSPLSNLSSMAFSNKLSKAAGSRSAGSGGLEVILNVLIAYDPNLSSITQHKVRILFGPDPGGTMSSCSGVEDGGPYVSQMSALISSPNEYRSGPASESVVHCFAISLITRT